MPQKMIEGVMLKTLRVIPDERGRVMEILRVDDEIFSGFGQVYLTTAYPGVVKAWHYHEKQYDCFGAIRGMMKVVLYDDRKDSPTCGLINEFFSGEHQPLLIRIPPRVYHGFKCISDIEATMINCPTLPYDYEHPDEYRLDPHESHIPYNWARKDG